MDLGDLFNRACSLLQGRNLTYAVAGGFAAALYREQPRLTNDADIALLAGVNEKEVAEEILGSLGLESIQLSRIADLEGGPIFATTKKSTPPAVVIGREESKSAGPGVDFILSSVPWVSSAVARAQFNQLDFGFGRVPTLTVEDVLLAKMYARKGNYRPKDEDDLLSIFAANHTLDFNYLNSQMQKLYLVIPKSIRKQVPEILQKISKDVEKKIREKL